MSYQDDLKKLLITSQRRLQKLKEQKALKGSDTPSHILIEIEDTEEEINKLQTELQTLENDDRNKFQQSIAENLLRKPIDIDVTHTTHYSFFDRVLSGFTIVITITTDTRHKVIFNRSYGLFRRKDVIYIDDEHNSYVKISQDKYSSR